MMTIFMILRKEAISYYSTISTQQKECEMFHGMYLGNGGWDGGALYGACIEGVFPFGKVMETHVACNLRCWP